MSNGNELKKASIADLPCLQIGQKQCLCEISCEDCIESHVLAEGYRKQSGWISVEERLPEPNEECLVSARVGDRVVIDLGEIVQCWDGRTNKYGFTWMITNDWDEGEGCEITHWMPLPEPPKGE